MQNRSEPVSRMSVGQAVLRFRVELRAIAPPIWREIEVPSNYSFWDLHVAIQDAMGWLDYHLHAFLPANNDDDEGEWEIGIPADDELLGGRDMLASWTVPVIKHFKQAGDRMAYVYDFGDDWTHDVLLEEIIPADSVRPAACTDGERACPPEDCGGPSGYQSLLEALADPAHDQHEEMKHWTGGAFDPERFDPGNVRFDDPQERWNRAFRKS